MSCLTFTDTIGTRKRRDMQKQKHRIQIFYVFCDMFQKSALESDWLCFMFSIFPTHIGHASHIVMRRNSHTTCSLLTKQISLLYCPLPAKVMEHSTIFLHYSPPLQIYVLNLTDFSLNGLNLHLTLNTILILNQMFHMTQPFLIFSKLH